MSTSVVKHRVSNFHTKVIRSDKFGVTSAEFAGSIKPATATIVY